ncbi:MAG TPA: protein kinase [Thermoanaerobaculia bacterium]|jgi:predicted Ser/Thr protein kinase|nr:protein kinase [Thermoanaerobaculia bacterium]
MLLIALALPSVAAADEWDEAYKRGFDACIQGNWKLAVGELERAIAEAPNEFVAEEPKNGLTVYLPHYWLGGAKYYVGDYTGALREFRISEQQGVALKHPDYAHGLPNWIAKVKAEIAFAQAGEAQRRAQRAGGDRLEAYRKGQRLLQEAKDTFNQAGLATAPFLRAYDLAMEARTLFVAAKDEVTKPVPMPPPPDASPVPTSTSTSGNLSPADHELQWTANIAFNTPEQINLDEHRVIKLLLDVQIPATQLERQLHEPGKTETATIKISDSVEARLTGAAFDIRPITPELQAVSAAETTEWQWEVTPKQDGKHRLFLTVNNIQRKRSIRTFDRIIEVQVPPSPWIVPIAVLAGVVLLLSLLLFILRRRTPTVSDDPVADTVPVTVPGTTIKTPAAESSSGSMHFRQGEMIDERYRIVGLLGQGGMGAVYSAEDREFEGELVALKTILTPTDSKRVLARFKKEIQLARRVAHPNVCRIFDVGYHVSGPGERTIFVSMEYITGVPLKTVIQQKGRLNEPETLAIIRDVAAALDATHAAGLIHRDIKSGNVMLSDKGDRAVLMDFGVACLSNPSEGDQSLTKTGAIIGTPAYMSPEQIEGATLTAATDIYAFGMVIYEMVTGRLPYEGDTPVSILAKRLRERPRSPAHFVPNLKKEWEETILTCLEHDPAKRFRLAMDVYRALDRAAEAPTLVM